MKEQAPKAYALCSLPVELNIFTELTKDNQVLHFCCEGCKNIYRLINAEELKPEEKADKH